jgi:hypothetical protein
MNTTITPQPRRRWRAFLPLLLLLVLPLGRAVQAANENYCPGSPWNCTKLVDCTDRTWCVDDAGTCAIGHPNFQHKKYLIIKICFNGPQSVSCSACGSDTTTGTCCDTASGEPECPNVTACP